MANFLKKAFEDMKENAKAQHEADKAELQAVKAESRATFEENRGHNTFAKAKEDARKFWDDAHMSTAEINEKMRAECADRVENANARISEAEARYEAAKKN